MGTEFIQVTLPSKCLVYPGVNPGSIQLRTFRGEEEQLIAELGVGNARKKILSIMKNVVRGIDPSILTVGDVSFILVWEAINSYSNVYTLRILCEGCRQMVDIDFDLNNLEKVELPNTFVQPYEVKLSNTVVKLRLLTLKDDIEIVEMEQQNQSTYLYGLALSIVDENVSAIGRQEILKTMSTKDLREIRKFHSKYAHGPDMNTTYICPKCDWKGRVLLPFRLNKFISDVT